ncbi:MAG: DUF1294 domain-containing protein [Clostridia bacterium]
MYELILAIYLIFNLITFIFYAVDKRKAIKQHYRIPEKTLISLGFFGGALGALLAMLITRHKIRKPKFYILIPLFLVLQIALSVFIIGGFYEQIQIPFI